MYRASQYGSVAYVHGPSQHGGRRSVCDMPSSHGWSWPVCDANGFDPLVGVIVHPSPPPTQKNNNCVLHALAHTGASLLDTLLDTNHSRLFTVHQHAHQYVSCRNSCIVESKTSAEIASPSAIAAIHEIEVRHSCR